MSQEPFLEVGRLVSNPGSRLGTDADLLQAIAAQRSEAALEELAQRHSRAIFNVAHFITADERHAEDVLQETLLGVWQGARTFDASRGNARSWLLRMATHKAIRLKTGLGKKTALVKRYRSGRPTQAPDTPYGTEALETLRALLSQLSDLDRQLIALYFGAGCSQDEMAVALRIPQRTISKRLALALDGLRSGLKQAGFGAAVCGPELLNEALCAGWPAPAGPCRASELLSASATTNPVGGLRPRQVRALLGTKASWLLLAAPLCCGVLYRGLVPAQGQLDPGATSAIAAAPAASVPVPPGTRAGPARATPENGRFKRSWNFDDPNPLDGLELLFAGHPDLGYFSYAAHDGLKEGGCLRTRPTGGTLALPIHPGVLPLKVSFKIRFLEIPQGRHPGLCWGAAYGYGVFQNLKGDSLQRKTGTWYEYRYFLTETSIDAWTAEAGRFQVTCIDDLAYLRIKELWLSCPVPALVDDLVAEQCPAEEIPDLSEFQQADLLLKDQFKVGQMVPVPGLHRHAIPGQEVHFLNSCNSLGYSGRRAFSRPP